MQLPFGRSALVLALTSMALSGCGQQGGRTDSPEPAASANEPIVMYPTVGQAQAARQADTSGPLTPSRPRRSSNLAFKGGSVETAPVVYIVYWGSQWNNNDPSGEAALQQSFFKGVGGSSWGATNTQYCQGVASGTVYCNGAGTPAGNQSGMLKGTWYDNASAAPSSPTQAQLAAEAARAAAHFGNTTAASNANAQYIISTATGNSASGFGSQYCAWHSSTSTSYGTVAYTNFPYITDAGSGCGANFNGLGPNAGITIVGGHEWAESVTDPFPSSGWVDGSGSEIGDKCAWISSGQGASADITLSTGTFAVQSLWSNAFNSGAGGCVLSYP